MDRNFKASYRFDRFTLDLDRGTLLEDGGSELAVRPKAFAMLRYFVENAERLIDRDELIRIIWPDVIVSDDSVTQCIAEIRRALGGSGQRLLRPVQRRGYRFSAPVSQVTLDDTPAAERVNPPEMPRADTDR